MNEKCKLISVTCHTEYTEFFTKHILTSSILWSFFFVSDFFFILFSFDFHFYVFTRNFSTCVCRFIERQMQAFSFLLNFESMIKKSRISFETLIALNDSSGTDSGNNSNLPLEHTNVENHSRCDLLCDWEFRNFFEFHLRNDYEADRSVLSCLYL